jgi:hypothetical protein
MPPGISTANDNALSDTDIALLCDIGTYSAEGSEPEKNNRVARLMASGFVTCSHPDMATAGARFMLTGKGEAVLVARGAGLNES